MYNIVRRNMSLFNEMELKALIIAALGHDLDHGGFTNNFLQLTDDTLAQLYEESPLENHHYQVTMLILQGCEIYPHIDKDDFVKLSKELKDAILATDLASYFKFRVKLLKIINETGLDWQNQRHRTLIKSIMMTSSDLSGNCKPFLVSKYICANVYREFYNQGDLEKKMGLVPLSLMDRDKSANVPEDQVQFLTVVVLPCVDLLRKIFPNTRELYDQTIALRESWQEIIKRNGQKNWRQYSVTEDNELFEIINSSSNYWSLIFIPSFINHCHFNYVAVALRFWAQKSKICCIQVVKFYFQGGNFLDKNQFTRWISSFNLLVGSPL